MKAVSACARCVSCVVCAVKHFCCLNSVYLLYFRLYASIGFKQGRTFAVAASRVLHEPSWPTVVRMEGRAVGSLSW
jgi:hypothetical protein